jgi:2'-5' RNA ligase
MRVFIAIELPEEIKNALQRLQLRLRQTGADVKWVAQQNIHLTLKFLGEIDDEKANSLSQAIEDIAKRHSVFTLHIAKLGAFPKRESPRVIWVGIGQGDEQVKKIALALEEKIALLGIPKEERPFSSHITIGRTRSMFNRQNLIQELKKLEDSFALDVKEFLVDKLTLFKSTLTPRGPLYTILKEASLRAS